MISAWTTLAFVVFFLYVLGDLIFNWWSAGWWVWVAIGIFGIGAISSTLRYIAYRSGAERDNVDYSQNNYDSNYQIQDNEERNVSSSSVRIIESQTKKEEFCKYCGQSITGPASYCPNCGAMVD